MLSTTLALLLQVGPNPSAGAVPSIPPELDELRARQRASAKPNDNFTPDRLNACLARAEADAVAARTEAEDWLGRAQGIERAQSQQCRGYAQAILNQWGDAGRSFSAARDAVPAGNHIYRGQLGAMAANAWLTAGDNRRALETLEIAIADAFAAEQAQLQAELLSDKARALVALQRPAEAASALKTARELAPWNARIWLLSATLARRSDDLANAQAFIEQAGMLDPSEPRTGLEAGVIAVLSGNDAAAKRSWESVISLAPDSPEAQTARSYLEQVQE